MSSAPAVAPASYAGRPLFEPIGPWLRRFADPALPGLAALNAVLAEAAPTAVSGAGRPLRFVSPPGPETAYEAHINATGEVPTRPGDWHDFFNALAWCVWPQAKATCNALHVEQLARPRALGQTGRGACRDALTQFDECGMVVVSADPDIPALLAAHAWAEVFWQRRQPLRTSTRFLVFGHGSWDQLRQPFVGLCAKVLYRQVAADWLMQSPAAQQAETDRWLADHLRQRGGELRPREWSPLPLLGIPGVTPDSEAASYYRDVRQFRPRRAVAA